MTKLGESTFAEVFNGIFNDCRVAMKIVPFGGDIPVNGCPQTSMDDGTGRNQGGARWDRSQGLGMAGRGKEVRVRWGRNQGGEGSARRSERSARLQLP